MGEQLYRRVDNPVGKIVQYVGGYVLTWKWADKPMVGFVEYDGDPLADLTAANAEIKQLQEQLQMIADLKIPWNDEPYGHDWQCLECQQMQETAKNALGKTPCERVMLP